MKPVALIAYLIANSTKTGDVVLDPNGGKRNPAEAAHLKRTGVRAGVPDLCVPVARGGYHGLFIEMKVKPNKPTALQTRWIDELRAQGYAACVCYSADAAIEVLSAYLLDDGA